LCNSTFSISHGGRADINDHVNKKKHKGATLPSSSNKMSSFFKPTVAGKEELKSAVEEGTLHITPSNITTVFVLWNALLPLLKRV
jgi:hypothetical protein